MADTAFTNGVTTTAAAWFNEVNTATHAHLTSVSGTNTIVGTGPISMTAYAAGQKFTFVVAVTNTTAVTLNITPSGGTALGAKAITKTGTTALSASDLVAGMIVEVIYDGTQFQIPI